MTDKELNMTDKEIRAEIAKVTETLIAKHRCKILAPIPVKDILEELKRRRPCKKCKLYIHDACTGCIYNGEIKTMEVF